MREDHARIIDILQFSDRPLSCDEIAERLKLKYPDRKGASGAGVSARFRDAEMRLLTKGEWVNGHKEWSLIKADSTGQQVML